MKNPGVFTGMRCLDLVSYACRLMMRLYLARPDITKVQQWIVQGGGGNNPDKNHHSRVNNNDSTAKTREAVPYFTSAVAENNVPLDIGGEKPVLSKLHKDRFTLENWKCYLDSCATYHNFSVREFLDRV